LADFFCSVQLYGAARAFESQAHETFDRRIDSFSPERIEHLCRISHIEALCGLEMSAINHLEKALGIYETVVSKCNEQQRVSLSDVHRRVRLLYMMIARDINPESSKLIGQRVVHQYEESSGVFHVPKLAKAHVELSKTYLALDDVEGAERSTKQAIDLLVDEVYADSALQEARHTLGRICMRDGRLQEAFKHLATSLAPFDHAPFMMSDELQAAILEDCALLLLRASDEMTEAPWLPEAVEQMEKMCARRLGRQKGVKELVESALKRSSSKHCSQSDTTTHNSLVSATKWGMGFRAAKLVSNLSTAYGAVPAELSRTAPRRSVQHQDGADHDEAGFMLLPTVTWAMFEQALVIRQQCVPDKSHPLVAASLIRLADVYWFGEAYEQARATYMEALHMYISSLGEACRQVAQLHSWLSFLNILCNDLQAAKRHHTKAVELVEAKATFGRESWEFHRCLQDKAQLLVLDKGGFYNNARSHGRQGAAEFVSAHSRQAAAYAERIETQARSLEEKLKKQGTRDNALKLSWFAPIRRREGAYAAHVSMSPSRTAHDIRNTLTSLGASSKSVGRLSMKRLPTTFS